MLPATQTLGTDNSVKFPDGSTVTLDGLAPVEIFTKGAKCWDGKAKIHCPEPTVFSKKENDGSKVLVAKDKDGKIKSIRMKKRNGKSETLHAMEDETNVFAYIPDDAIDEEFFSRFTLAEKTVQSIGKNVRRQLRGVADREVSPKRNLQTSCTQFREIELAVAVESSFCAAIGASQVDAKVQSIVTDIATDYEQDGLCFTVTLVHFEKHCDPNFDPYKPGVQLNQSGCGGDGL